MGKNNFGYKSQTIIEKMADFIEETIEKLDKKITKLTRRIDKHDNNLIEIGVIWGMIIYIFICAVYVVVTSWR
jgi:tetrahydromethanopterin S-methyltransferase subunit G